MLNAENEKPQKLRMACLVYDVARKGKIMGAKMQIELANRRALSLYFKKS